MDKGSDGRLPLSDVLAELGRSFREAQSQSAAHPDGPIFGWTSADVELEVSMTLDASGKARCWVVEAGAATTRMTAAKVSVHISPWGGEMIGGGM